MRDANAGILAAFAFALAAPVALAQGRTYELEYVLDLTTTPARSTVVVRQAGTELREISFEDAPSRWSSLEATGSLTRDGDRWRWAVPKKGGSLSFDAPIERERGGSFDARRTADWALFRGEDVFPAMASRSLRGAESQASLRVRLPAGWSFVTALERGGSGGVYRIDNPARRFDRPTGWMLAGDSLGVRIERIGGTTVIAAAPAGESVRRQDMLALVNWVLPTLRRALGEFPDRLVIVSANDPFWRGGLSGPDSLYIHADRPLISENGTSTLVHELFHVGFPHRGAADDDWIAEGLAEYYSVWLLHRSGTTTARRFRRTLAELNDWADDASGLRGPYSRGAVTARAATLFHALNREIEAVTDGRRSLDDVVRRLGRNADALSLDALRAAAEHVLGRAARTLSDVPYQTSDDDRTSAGSP